MSIITITTIQTKVNLESAVHLAPPTPLHGTLTQDLLPVRGQCWWTHSRAAIVYVGWILIQVILLVVLVNSEFALQGCKSQNGIF